MVRVTKTIQEGEFPMKHALSLAIFAAAMMVVGCSSNNKKPAMNSSVTDIRSTTPPAPPPMVQPIQPVQPVQAIQPVVADTSPVAVASATPAITGSSYTVQKGDTLFKIARARYGDASAVKKIKEANPGLDANHIKAGQKINLP
jgi:5'-nucleotidase